jgi:superfamily II DNA or RNA helicase
MLRKDNKLLELFKKEQLNELNTTLGHNGYVLYKEQLTQEQINEIKSKLTVEPNICKDFVIGEVPKIPLYLENKKKLYIPRCYGIKQFGNAKNVKLQEGQDINVQFTGQLRDNQKAPVNEYLNSMKDINSTKGLLSLETGFGKCNARDTPIMMYDGTIKMVQDVKVGDKIMGDDSTPRTVLSLARGREMMYDIIPNKGDTYTVNESHILSLRCSYTLDKTVRNDPIKEAQRQKQKYIQGKIIDISVKDFIELPKQIKNHLLKGYRVPINFPEKEIDIDPYILGYWLGDCSSRGTGITTIDEPVIQYFKNYAEKLELFIREDIQPNKCTTYYITGSHKKINTLLVNLQKHNLIKNKHIPHIYKCNSRKIRLELLAGIIDSDGSYNYGGYDIIQKNEELLDDIIFLARTLGFAAYKKKCEKSCIYKDEKKTGTYYRTYIHGEGIEQIPIKLERKKPLTRKQIKNVLNTSIKVVKKEVDDYYGFEIDGNRRFVLGDCTVTHNTALSIYILCQLKKKTLIVVHKKFLENQWIERILQFTNVDKTRIGIIRQNKVQVEDKDIVIGSLQSLTLKDYDTDIFNQFGLVICDEIHSMASNCFSQLFHLVNYRYFLGLSATMKRQDGLHKVYHYFFGDLVYHSIRQADNKVDVHLYEYYDKDPAYSQEYTLTFNGKPNSALMMNNICKFKPRIEKVVQIIMNIFEENNERKILLLSSRKEQLSLIFKGIKDKLKEKGKTIGFYIGGMKQEQLKESEEKDLILATYAFAKEGVDIPSLDTLVQISPMSEITQAVGRILRKRPEDRKYNPLIVDIIDMFSIFKGQSKKRLNFYKQNQYNVIYKERLEPVPTYEPISKNVNLNNYIMKDI